jgi:uncharacterized protein YecE (DUF72 family)
MHWRGPFYPEDMPPRQFLTYYAERFDTAEINNSFYRLPTANIFGTWRDSVADDFIFAVKASRYITHMKKLKDPEEPLSRLYGAVEGLGKKLGPILFQLPPGWKFNAERLETFLDALSDKHRHTFEFRNATWFNEQTLELLRKRSAAFCIYELEGMISPKEVTADFLYVRMHGPGGKYQGRYDRETLAGWVKKFKSWARSGKDVYCYFDNDDSGHAAMNAAEMREMVNRP